MQIEGMDRVSADIGRFNEALGALADSITTAMQPAIDRLILFAQAWAGVDLNVARRERLRRRARVAHLLEHDPAAPAWVLRLNAEQVEAFGSGSGNGRGPGWVDRV